MISTYDWFGYEIPIEARYRLIKNAGFDGVLLWWSEGFGRGDYRRGVELARKAGLYIENIHTPIQSQNDLWCDNLDGQAVFDCYMQCISDCSDYEIPTMVVHLPEENYPYNELGFDRIKRIAEKADRLRVNVALENVRNYSNLKFVLDKVKSERIGFCYDCCHHYNYLPEVDLLEHYGSRLMAIHLHDNGGERGQHQLPFDGNIDWNEVMKKIAQTGYVGPTALEPMNWDYLELSPEEFLERAYERARKLEVLRYGENNVKTR